MTARELGLLVEAQITLIVCELIRWRRPVGELVHAEHVANRPDRAPSDMRVAGSVAWAVTRATRYGVFRPQCLVRSLAVHRMLRRRGIESSALRIGVRLEHGSLLAHAWVELHGMVIGDAPHHVASFVAARDMQLRET